MPHHPEQDWPEDEWVTDVPNLTVEITDNPVIAVLYGPDGETPLITWFERRTVPIGYHSVLHSEDGE